MLQRKRFGQIEEGSYGAPETGKLERSGHKGPQKPHQGK